MAVEESQVYRDLMRLKPNEWTPNAWAVKAGVSRTVWADMRKHGNPSRRTLEKLLKVAGSSLAEFEALRIGVDDSREGMESTKSLGDVRAQQWMGAPLPPIPLFATASGGDWEGMPMVQMTELYPGRLTAQLARPVSLAGDRGTYALAIVGESMWPRFRPNRQVAVSPQAPVAIGDDVVVRLKIPKGSKESEERVVLLIKELVERTTDHVELRQFNPDVIFRVPTNRIAAMHKVAGELI